MSPFYQSSLRCKTLKLVYFFRYNLIKLCVLFLILGVYTHLAGSASCPAECPYFGDNYSELYNQTATRLLSVESCQSLMNVPTKSYLNTDEGHTQEMTRFFGGNYSHWHSTSNGNRSHVAPVCISSMVPPLLRPLSASERVNITGVTFDRANGYSAKYTNSSGVDVARNCKTWASHKKNNYYGVGKAVNGNVEKHHGWKMDDGSSDTTELIKSTSNGPYATFTFEKVRGIFEIEILSGLEEEVNRLLKFRISYSAKELASQTHADGAEYHAFKNVNIYSDRLPIGGKFHNATFDAQISNFDTYTEIEISEWSTSPSQKDYPLIIGFDTVAARGVKLQVIKTDDNTDMILNDFKVLALKDNESKCFNEESFAKAEALCASAGARLCTIDELSQQRDNEECYHSVEGRNIWSGTPCSAPMDEPDKGKSSIAYMPTEFEIGDNYTWSQAKEYCQNMDMRLAMAQEICTLKYDSGTNQNTVAPFGGECPTGFFCDTANHKVSNLWTPVIDFDNEFIKIDGTQKCINYFATQLSGLLLKGSNAVGGSFQGSPKGPIYCVSGLEKSDIIYTNSTSPNKYTNCRQILEAGLSTGDGIYDVYLPEHLRVYCDMSKGGRTAIARIPKNQKCRYLFKEGAQAEVEEDYYKYSDAHINEISGDNPIFTAMCIPNVENANHTNRWLFREAGWKSRASMAGWFVLPDEVGWDYIGKGCNARPNMHQGNNTSHGYIFGKLNFENNTCLEEPSWRLFCKDEQTNGCQVDVNGTTQQGDMIIFALGERFTAPAQNATLHVPLSSPASKCRVGQFWGQYYQQHSNSTEISLYSTEKLLAYLDRETPIVSKCESRPWVSSPFEWETPLPTGNRNPTPKWNVKKDTTCFGVNGKILDATNSQLFHVTPYPDICKQKCAFIKDCTGFMFFEPIVVGSDGPGKIGTGACYFYLGNATNNETSSNKHCFFIDQNYQMNGNDDEYYKTLEVHKNIEGVHFNHKKFIVRWTGAFQIRTSGYYRLYDASNDGSRMWIDGEYVPFAQNPTPENTFRNPFERESSFKSKWIRVPNSNMTLSDSFPKEYQSLNLAIEECKAHNVVSEQCGGVVCSDGDVTCKLAGKAEDNWNSPALSIWSGKRLFKLSMNVESCNNSSECRYGDFRNSAAGNGQGNDKWTGPQCTTCAGSHGGALVFKAFIQVGDILPNREMVIFTMETDSGHNDFFILLTKTHLIVRYKTGISYEAHFNFPFDKHVSNELIVMLDNKDNSVIIYVDGIEKQISFMEFFPKLPSVERKYWLIGRSRINEQYIFYGYMADVSIWVGTAAEKFISAYSPNSNVYTCTDGQKYVVCTFSS